jgi:hypothetical protein
MGLDQSAFLKEKEKVEKEFSWRKHSRLQTFMEYLWMSRGNKGEFNSVSLELNQNDIIQFKKAVNNGFENFICEGGFFWGTEFQEDAASEYAKQDLEFADEALVCLEGGGAVSYYNNW